MKIYLILEHNPPGKSRVVGASIDHARAKESLLSFEDFPTGPSCSYSIQEQDLEESKI